MRDPLRVLTGNDDDHDQLNITPAIGLSVAG
jgi:hypothetical protein